VGKRKAVVFTGNRAEYGLLSPVIKAISEDAVMEVQLIISGAHLLENFGETIKEIDVSNISRVKKIMFNGQICDNKLQLPQEFSTIVSKGAQVLKELDPDMIVLGGDRYETFAMAIASFYMNIPIAHLFGGDLSQGGNLDDSVRHSITKLAHLHFTTNEDARKRVIGLGEEEWRVFNVGSTSIDNIVSGEYASADSLEEELDLDFQRPVVLFTQHPITTEAERAYEQVKESLEALKAAGYQTVITYPCNDPGGNKIVEAITEYRDVPNFKIVKSLGWKNYLGLLKVVSMVIGNSSSGLIETSLFKVPCINVGARQAGRLRSENVIDVPYDREKIKEAMHKALNDPEFLKKVKNCVNPYGDGKASCEIVSVLRSIPLNKALLQKKMSF